jgi:hypothetical protein
MMKLEGTDLGITADDLHTMSYNEIVLQIVEEFKHQSSGAKNICIWILCNIKLLNENYEQKIFDDTAALILVVIKLDDSTFTNVLTVFERPTSSTSTPRHHTRHHLQQQRHRRDSQDMPHAACPSP